MKNVPFCTMQCFFLSKQCSFAITIECTLVKFPCLTFNIPTPECFCHYCCVVKKEIKGVKFYTRLSGCNPGGPNNPDEVLLQLFLAFCGVALMKLQPMEVFTQYPNVQLA